MRSLLTAGMLLGCGLCAYAVEVEITATEHDGAIRFDRITNAPGTQVTGYRVQWSNDGEGAWQSFGIDDLDFIPPDGSASVTAAVPAFFRVAARMQDYLVVDMSGGWEGTGGFAGTNLFPMRFLSDIPPGGWTDDHKTTQMVFRLIPAGTFAMGSPPGELGRDTDEDQHTVTITLPFYIAIFPVTQKQWELMTPFEPDKWPSYFSNATYRETRPVEQVSYLTIRGSAGGQQWPLLSETSEQTLNFMWAMRRRIGMDVDLPTEAQWEYAARAGTTTALNSGNNLNSTDEDPLVDAVARYFYNSGDTWDPDGDTTEGTAAVGSYQPNVWGLYDMHGNTWEWCLDWYGAYPTNAVTDPKGPSNGTGRAIRGGSYENSAALQRSAIRYFADPDAEQSSLGFRLVIPVVD